MLENILAENAGRSQWLRCELWINLVPTREDSPDIL